MMALVDFFKEVQRELAKVVWPESREFVGAVVVVLTLICAFAVYLGVVDFCFQWLARHIFVKYGL
jgi:preprotein translocase subunit SecE